MQGRLVLNESCRGRGKLVLEESPQAGATALEKAHDKGGGRGVVVSPKVRLPSPTPGGDGGGDHGSR